MNVWREKRVLYMKISVHFLSYLAQFFLLHAPWSRVLLEKLISFQQIKKFPVFYGTRRFITTFKSARHLSLSWPPVPILNWIDPDHTPTSHFLKIHLNVILRWVSQVVCFPQISPPKPRIQLSSLQYALCTPPISFFSILLLEKYWLKGTDH